MEDILFRLLDLFKTFTILFILLLQALQSTQSSQIVTKGMLTLRPRKKCP